MQKLLIMFAAYMQKLLIVFAAYMQKLLTFNLLHIFKNILAQFYHGSKHFEPQEQLDLSPHCLQYRPQNYISGR